MTAGAGPERASSPACWCCGGECEEAGLVRLGEHPEVGICLDCAVWVKRRAAARRHEQHLSLPGRLRSGLDTIRNAVIARGWHERGALGMVLCRVDRWLP